MLEYILNNKAKYSALLWQHLSLTLIALIICAILGIFIGVLCFKNRIFNNIATATASALRVVPSIATIDRKSVM